jgi:hypothetical protein
VDNLGCVPILNLMCTRPCALTPVLSSPYYFRVYAAQETGLFKSIEFCAFRETVLYGWLKVYRAGAQTMTYIALACHRRLYDL